MAHQRMTQKASIVAPVSRLLAVADLGRSVAFYREVLGFASQSVAKDAAQVSSGPATIQLKVGSAAMDSTFQVRPRGTAMIFFETDDVAAMREAVIARGGTASTLEKVNWIKMQVFQVQDPDGHTLWFGASFREPEHAQPDPMMWQIMPNFPCSSVPAAVTWYRDILGFTTNYAQDDFGVMDRDKARILLVQRNEKFKGIGSCYVYVRDADALHAELTARRANVQGVPVSHPWGLRDFRVLDPDGNEMTFGQPFE